MSPTLAQYEDWTRRLGRLVDEMERAFGEPGQNNQDVLDAAVHVAYHLAAQKANERGEERDIR